MNAADGSGVTKLTDNPASDSEPAWSPDGQKLAFTSDRDGDNEVYVMNAADGSGVTKLTDNPAFDSEPAWSPDGQKLAFTSDRDGLDLGDFDVYVMNADGSGPVDRLTTSASGSRNPDWQPLPSADLSLGLTASPRTLTGNGKSLTYTITVANAGPTAAKDVVVTDALPAQTRFTSVGPSQGSCSAPPVGSVGTVVCSLGMLAKGASGNVTIVVKVVARKTTVVNTASVTSATADPNPANNSATDRSFTTPQTPPATRPLRLTLSGASPQRPLVSKRVATKATCSKPCMLTATGSIAIAGARIALDKAHAKLAAPGTAVLALSVSSTARRRLAGLLRGGRQGRAVITVGAVDDAGARARATFRVVIRR
jgi:TolB protein